MSDLNFDDLTPISVTVSIGGKPYILREASGDAVCKWRNALLKSTRLGPEGRPQTIDGMADTEPFLVSMCLFEPYETKTGEQRERPVPLQTIRSWPNRVQKTLFEKLQEISKLADESSESADEKIRKLREEIADLERRKTDEGNLPGAMTGGSV